jgi:phosphatidylinositol alpha 1,6-mannosyltransferase
LPDEEHRIIPMYRTPSVALPLQKGYHLALPSYQPFAKYLHEFQPDIIHINSPCTLGCSASRFARRFGVPVVATYHTHFPSYPRYYNLGTFEKMTWDISRKFYNALDKTFVPALPVLEELCEHGLKNLTYLPNGVDTKKFNPFYRSSAWRESVGARKKSVILFVSRLVWEKDLRVLADVYNRLSWKRDDFVFVIIGDGHARKELERLMPGAKFLGFQTGLALQEAFASSDIFVFPSTTETFGLVTVEAMSAGAVPVAAKAGGAAGIIEEGISGFLTEPRNAAHMAKQVELLLDNPSLQLKMAYGAHKRAQLFDWENVMDQLFEEYEALHSCMRQARSLVAA